MACCGKTTDRTTVKTGAHGCVLCRIWQILTREKTPEGDPCVVVPGHVIRKPDPCIYDQFLLMQLNQPVTWDNPDVRIFLGGVEQYTYNLTAGTEYDVTIEVHNSSRDEPANGTTVDVRWIEFGAGGQTRHPIATLNANVPVWPGAAIVPVKWRTPDVPGHYCIEVELSHPDDGNPSNNRGWNNTQVHAAHSVVTQKIPIFNRYPDGCPAVKEGGGPILRPHRVFLGWGVLGLVAGLVSGHANADTGIVHTLSMMAAGYILLSAVGLAAEWAYAWMIRQRNEQRGEKRRADRTSCYLVQIDIDSYVFQDGSGKAFDPKARFEGKGPLWPATVTPSSFLFVPGEAMREVELRVEAPDGPGPAGTFNVNVRQGGVPSGGVTLTITTGGP
ncbi:MAG: hypothetical protein JSR21_19740 [Proteobacteria bacterium]|nr:hypothetical protein [Pseudomonadota bacterium]